MRIVFECYGTAPAQVCCNGRHYCSPVREPPKWKGMRAEVMMVFPNTGCADSSDAVYIEGDLATIRQALQDALDQLNEVEKDERELFGQIAARTVQCSQCSMYYDSKLEDSGHSDGRGGTCRGV